MTRTAALRLTQAELESCKPISGQGDTLRAYCPFHGSDRQRSLQVTVDTGRFYCFACGVWGYLQSSSPVHEYTGSNKPVFRPPVASKSPLSAPPPSARLTEWLERYQRALSNSLGERYLAWRGIPLSLARRLSIGYAACGDWAHFDGPTGRPVRQWKYGRLVFPHTDVDGHLVNLYGRAVGSDAVPKALRHDHLRGPKGYFNAQALNERGPVYICEGPFDALSLLAAGAEQAVAIFGVAGWRWPWARASELIFAFDADEAGMRWRDIAWQAVLRGKQVSTFEPTRLQGCKDINEAWVKGLLTSSMPECGDRRPH